VREDGAVQISEEGVALIRHFEGCSLDAYLCPAGVWTVGYGHTGDVKQGDVIDQEQAEALLIEDLEEFEGYVTALCQRSLEQCQFDALVSWVFNLGPGNFKSSTLLRRLNAGDLGVVPHEIRRWNKAGGRVLSGLVKRREAEALMFQGLDWRSVV